MIPMGISTSKDAVPRIPRRRFFIRSGDPENGSGPKVPDGKPAWMLRILCVAACVCVFLYAADIHLTIPQQAVVGYGLLGLVLVLMRLPSAKTQPIRTLILLTAAFITLRYCFFRTFYSLTYTGFLASIAMLLLYGAEMYSALIYFSGMFVNLWPLERKVVQLPENRALWPIVDIFIPTYNEPEEMVKITVSSCSQMDYPADKLNIYILDDGGTIQKRNSPDAAQALAANERASRLKKIAQELGVNYITRERNEHAKAGNLNNALQRTRLAYAEKTALGGEWLNWGTVSSPGDLVLILDCDHVPTMDFLKNTAGLFLKDEKLFLVQTPHFFINPNPIEKNLGTHNDAPNENEMFYRAVQPGLDFWNSSFFCGSAALLRRNYLEEAGGISGDTITEDAETAISLHAKGYRSAYLLKPMICGLSPDTFEDFMIQRSRWTQGMIQILLLKKPFSKKGLSWYQRLCYTNNCLFWFFGLARSIFIIAPLVYLFFGFGIYNASPAQILVYAVPHLLCSMAITNYLFGEVRWPFFSELFETVQSIFLVGPIIGAILNPSAPKFKVTPKGKNLDSDYLSLLSVPFYIILVMTLVGLPAAAARWSGYPMQRGAIAACLAWVLFNIFLVMSCLGIVYELRQVRRQHRILTTEKAKARIAGADLDVNIHDISLGGLSIFLHGEHPVRVNERLMVSAEGNYSDRPSIKARRAALIRKRREAVAAEPAFAVAGNIPGQETSGIHARRSGMDGSLTMAGGLAAGPGPCPPESAGSVCRVRYSIPVTVKRVQQTDGGVKLGCIFETDSVEDVSQIIAFVYGDSSRWENFWQNRKDPRARIAIALFYLFFKGAKGARRNMQATLAVVAKYTGRGMESLWEKWKKYAFA